MPDNVSIGGASLSFDAAYKHAYSYLNDHRSGNPDAMTWSYPAYDGYQAGSGDGVDDADLLAIVLLNAGRRPVRAYYGLKELVPRINERLIHPALEGTLERPKEGTIEAVVDLYNIVNEYHVPYVRLTTLTKVLHRKKPELLPLFDLNIRRCYVHRGDPPPLARYGRSESREFIWAWVTAVQQDLVKAGDYWRQFANLAPGPRITPLRAMDIVGWELGRRPRDYFNNSSLGKEAP